MTKIASLNLCLGLKNKKDLVKNILMTNEIDVLAMQETELESSFDCNLLNIPGYTLEIENNSTKKRVGFYIKNAIRFERCEHLENPDSHLLIIDIKIDNIKKRLINIYRSFNPPNVTAKDLFITQCDLIKTAFTNDTIVMGDFNLDYKRKHDVNYSNVNLFDLFDERMDDLNLVQLIEFDTWSRMVGLVVKSSILDHIYVNDVSLLKSITHTTPIFGHHKLIM